MTTIYTEITRAIPTPSVDAERQWRIELARRQKAERDEAERCAVVREFLSRDGPLGFLPSDALARAAPRREWLVPGVVAAGTHGILFGPEKSFKTSIAIELAIAGATGSPFLGEFAVPAAFKSLVVSAESGVGVIAADADAIARTKGSTLTDLGESVYWSSHRLDLTRKASPYNLDRIIRAVGVKLLILDPAYQCLVTPGDTTDLMAMGANLAPLATLASQTGCAVLLVHHALKGSDIDFKPPKLSDVNGAGFGAWAAQWLMVKPARPRLGSRFALWFSAGCRGAAPVDRIIEIDRGDDGLAWGVRSHEPNAYLAARRVELDERKARRSSEGKRQTIEGHKARILDAVKASGGPQTKSAIRRVAGVSPAYFDTAWGELEAERAIGSVEFQKNRRTETGWAVGADDSAGAQFISSSPSAPSPRVAADGQGGR